MNATAEDEAGVTTAHSGDGAEAAQTESGEDGPGGDFIPDEGSCCGGEGFRCRASCDLFFQDCPEGEKCVPYASAGGSLDESKCVPVTGAAAAGEACTLDDHVSGQDDCDGSSYCFAPAEGGPGLCRSFCEGTPDDPNCTPGSTCSIHPLALCLPECSAEAPCGAGEHCYPTVTNDAMGCAPAGTISQSSACEEHYECAPGLMCIPGALVPNCELEGGDEQCCTQTCELANGDLDCAALPGTFCAPALAGGSPDTGPGVCVL